MTEPRDIIAFWIDEVGPKGWYEASDALDEEIRARFMADWQAAHDGARDHWKTSADGALGFLILTDQFPRNMFRGDARSFATDPAARACADYAIEHGLDMQIALPDRQFFYMPFMHSEAMEDQDRCIALMAERMAETPGQGDTLHARVHREIINRFGRFPYRNDALGRDTTPEERAFIDDGGYTELRKRFEAEGR
ncbi:DUF924 domain-containing protein [Aliiroseovarius sp. S1339]|uniref:DUF924 family protein n=1 Tax=Aliiroseovarius sp. S1339 TaxID=2936990 RepID=UPI0020BE8023|nr:DUF924 family protein [Aliiroseovarius sp. S1339]MCK8463714.1 DUF924 domain-containing protein [Aliiroseovarius sp. S1339]